MRILKVTQTYFPYLNMGGPPAKVRAIARALVQRGHEVTVLTADRGEDQTAGASSSRQKWGWEANDHGVEAVYLRTLQNYRATTINPSILRFCAGRLSEYDIVHIYGLYDLLGPAAAWFCRRSKIPYLIEPDGMFGLKLRSRQKKRLYQKLVGNALFEGASVVVANSDTERRELIDGGIPQEKIVLRRNGIDLAEFEALPAPGAFRATHNLDDETQLILFLGRISFIKGLDYLVEAFARVAQTHSNARLVIAGPDDADGCIGVIRKMISEFDLGDRVILSGPIFGNERLETFVDANVFVLPSRHESFGIVVAESIACGTPVLVTDQCGIAPLVDGCAALVVPCSVDELHKGLTRLLEDKDLLAELRAGCAEVARNLSWEEPIAAIESIYRSLVSQVDLILLPETATD